MTDFVYKQGTATTWKATGGTKAITLASLANGAGRNGVFVDLGANATNEYLLTAEFNLDAAPVAGRIVEVHWAVSPDTTTWPGGATGTDAAYKVGEEDEWAAQLSGVRSLSVTADADTVVQTQSWHITVPGRYFAPVVINNSGVAFEGDNDAHQITLTPLIPTTV